MVRRSATVILTGTIGPLLGIVLTMPTTCISIARTSIQARPIPTSTTGGWCGVSLGYSVLPQCSPKALERIKCKYRIAGRYRTARGYKHKIRTVAIIINRQIAPMYVLCCHKTVINHKKHPCNWGLFVALHKRSITWLGMRDSNPRMVGPEPTALPLGESPVLYNYIIK